MNNEFMDDSYRIYDSQSNWGSTRTKVSDAPDNLYILENGEYILFKSSFPNILITSIIISSFSFIKTH